MEEFVFDKASKESLELSIGSYSLKKALAQKVKERYIGKGVFLNYSYHGESIIKKSRSFK